MAKKDNRQIFGLECRECKSHNYVTQKNVTNTKDKLTMKKYCKVCRKSTPHDEFKKLH